MRFPFLLLSCCFISLAAQAQQRNPYTPPRFTDSARLQKISATREVVDRLYQQLAARTGAPGMSYGLVVDGELLYAGSIGVADRSSKRAVDSRTVFRMASMSKSFTALAILKLRDEGRIRLDEPASRYIPQLKANPSLTPDAPPLTIRHLLTHAGGFPEDNAWGDRQLDATDAALLKLAGEASLSTVPGTAYEYSNLGYALLGRIITVVAGMPYQRYITEKILRPLGMKETYFEWSLVPATQLAKGYRRTGEGWQEEPLLHDGAYGAMGGMLTSLADFARYLRLHQSAWPPSAAPENGVLRRSSLREMHQPANFSGLSPGYRYNSGRSCATASAYAYGLRWVMDCEEKRFVGHSGGLPGFGSNWTFMPDYGIGVVCFANLTYAPIGAFNQNVLDTIVRLAGLEKRMVTPSSLLNKRMEELAAVLPGWKGADKSGLFAMNFFLDKPLASWQKETADLLERVGPLRGSGRLQALNQLRGTFILEGEKGSIEVYFTLSPEAEGRIQEVQLRERKR
jgi:CubicO group peptidase (beta-lactamase class C family)